MPAVDFRKYDFSVGRINDSGKSVGRRVYWKLFAIENHVRIIVHSVLTAQISSDWWASATDPGLQGQVQARKAEYANQPWHTAPGQHEIYYTFLPDLTKIIAANSHLFLPIIPDIDQWVSRLEQVKVPRNIVGHMNWPSLTDRKRIDVCYNDIRELTLHLVRSGFGVAI